MFNQPPSQARFFKPTDMKDHLVLVTKYVGKEQVQDKFRGVCDQIEVELVDLDETQHGEPTADRYLIKHPSIINAIGTEGYTLGRIGMRTSKSTGNDYWTVLPFEAGKDDVRAEQWVKNNLKPKVAQPATAAPAPVSAGVSSGPSWNQTRASVLGGASNDNDIPF